MTDSSLITIIGLMGTGIAGEFGLIVWFIKSQRAAADAQVLILQKRITDLEAREDTTIQALADLMKPVPAAIQTMANVTSGIQQAIGSLSADMKLAVQVGQWQRSERGGERG